MRRERRRPTRAELAGITSRRLVVRRLSRRHDHQTPPDARKKIYPNRKHMFAPSEGGFMWTNATRGERWSN